MTEAQLKRAAEIHRDIGEIREVLTMLGSGDGSAWQLSRVYEILVGGRVNGTDRRQPNDALCVYAAESLRIAFHAELSRLKAEAEAL